MENKIFLSNRCVFLPDICQKSLRKNDVGSREIVLPRLSKACKDAKNAKNATNAKMQRMQRVQ